MEYFAVERNITPKNGLFGYRIYTDRPAQNPTGLYRVYYSYSPNGFSEDHFLGEFAETFETDDPCAFSRCYFHILDGSWYAIAAERRQWMPPMYNLRDLGLYHTADRSAFVRPGTVFRSDRFNALDEEGKKRFAELGFRYILDFRSDVEAAASGEDIAIEGALQERIPAWHPDEDFTATCTIEDLVHADPAERERELGIVRRGYCNSPFQNRAYRRLFEMLLQAPGPILFHCAGGKDRTGVAAAYFLLILGVPWETVLYDYTLTSHFARPRYRALLEKYADVLKDDPQLQDLMDTWILVRESNLVMHFDSIRARYSDLDDFFREELGIGPDEKAQLKKLYLICH